MVDKIMQTRVEFIINFTQEFIQYQDGTIFPKVETAYVVRFTAVDMVLRLLHYTVARFHGEFIIAFT